MSRPDSQPWYSGAHRALEPDVGPVDDGSPCGIGQCDREATYRVAWPHFGSDEALCPFHLCRFRAYHGEVWSQMRELDVEDPDAHAVRGQRFVTLDEVPDQIAIDGERMNRVALGVDGLALFDSAEPDDGTVLFATVNRRLEPVESREIARSQAGRFVSWYRDHEGVYRWDPDAQAALYGGEPADV